jgi:hypothetical protein
MCKSFIYPSFDTARLLPEPSRKRIGDDKNGIGVFLVLVNLNALPSIATPGLALPSLATPGPASPRDLL